MPSKRCYTNLRSRYSIVDVFSQEPRRAWARRTWSRQNIHRCRSDTSTVQPHRAAIKTRANVTLALRGRCRVLVLGTELRRIHQQRAAVRDVASDSGAQAQCGLLGCSPLVLAETASMWLSANVLHSATSSATMAARCSDAGGECEIHILFFW